MRGYMDEPPKKRRFWQVHLASLVIGSLTIAFVMMLFLGERNQWYINQGGHGYFRRWGLPPIAYADFQDYAPANVNDELPWYEPVMALRCKPLYLTMNNGVHFGGNGPGSNLIFYADM